MIPATIIIPNNKPSFVHIEDQQPTTTFCNRIASIQDAHQCRYMWLQIFHLLVAVEKIHSHGGIICLPALRLTEGCHCSLLEAIYTWKSRIEHRPEVNIIICTHWTPDIHTSQIQNTQHRMRKTQMQSSNVRKTSVCQVLFAMSSHQHNAGQVRYCSFPRVPKS